MYSNRYSNTPYRSYLEYRERNSTLAGLAASQLQTFGLRIGAETEHAFGAIVSGEYFPVLGIVPAAGRLIGPSDDLATAPPVVVLSHAFWRQRLGGAPDAVGRTIALNDHPFTIIGVAQPDFRGMTPPIVGDLWVPLAADAVLRPALDPAVRLDTIRLQLVGRLKPRIDRARAQADLDTIGRQLSRARGEPDDRQAVTVYGSTVLVPEFSSPVAAFLAALMTLVALVLLIICVNLANLVLARAAGRRAELAIRQSLGAGRARLVRQLLTENALVALAGAAAGVSLAIWCTRLLMLVTLPTPFPLALDLSVDVRVLAFSAAAAIAAALAFGVLPALSASSIDLVSAVKSSGGGSRHGRLRSAFLVAQVALSVLLLIAAGLFVRSLRHARSIDPGFDAADILTASVDLETHGYSESRGRALIQSLTRRLEAAPGIAAVNIADIVPVTLSNSTTFLLRDADAPPAPGQRPPTPPIYTNAVAPGHFRTLRIPMLAGRDFSDLDDAAAPRVAVVNETLARTFWPGEAALGQRLRPLASGRHHRGRRSRSRHQVCDPGRGAEAVHVSPAFAGLHAAPHDARPIGQPARVCGGDDQAGRSRIGCRACGLQRRPSVRRDVGVAPADAGCRNPAGRARHARTGACCARGLRRAVVSRYARAHPKSDSGLPSARRRGPWRRWWYGQAATWIVGGILIGMAIAFAASRLLEAFLFGISPTDPLTFVGVGVLLGLVALIAALVPAVRASRLDRSWP